jgi:co-chaperonin GroES (HSP10)
MDVAITPVNGRVILENPNVKEEVLPSGLILPAVRQEGRIRKSKVVAHAPDCESVKVGDVVLFDIGLNETFGEDELDEKYLIILESNILAYVL